MLSLQQQAGNRAVSGVAGQDRSIGVPVQRHAAGEDNELQATLGRLGLPQSALESTDDVDAEPETTPEDEPGTAPVQRDVGIAKEKTIKAYTKATAKGMADLTGTATEPIGEFLTRQGGVLADALAAHKVAPVPLRSANLGEDASRAHFNPNVWEIAINLDNLPSTVNRARGAELAGVLYHEARHAEQWFSLIRHVIFMLRRSGQLVSENTYAVRLKIPAPDPVIVAAFEKSKKQGFDKGEKSKWAGRLYDESVTAAHGMKQAALSPGLLAGEAAPNRMLAAARLASTQGDVLKDVRDSPASAPFPLDTTGWPVAYASALADEWTILKQVVHKAAVVAGMVGSTEPFDDPAAASACAILHADPAIGKARRRYLDVYGGLHKAVFNAAWDAYDRAYQEYRDLPVEKDAFAVQDRVTARLKKKLGL